MAIKVGKALLSLKLSGFEAGNSFLQATNWNIFIKLTFMQQIEIKIESPFMTRFLRMQSSYSQQTFHAPLHLERAELNLSKQAFKECSKCNNLVPNIYLSTAWSLNHRWKRDLREWKGCYNILFNNNHYMKEIKLRKHQDYLFIIH